MAPRFAISTVILLTWSAAFVSDAAVGQEAPPPLPSQFKHLEALEPFIGVWEGEATPPGGPKGTVRGTCTWENNRSYAYFDWTFSANGSMISVHPFSVRVGFNGKTQSPHFWVASWEAQADGPAVIEPNKMTISGEGITADGSKGSRHVVYELDGDTLTVRETQVVLDGKKLPDQTIVLHRKADSNATTEELLAEVEGTWRLEQEDGRWTTKTISGNKSKLVRYNADGTVRAGHDTEFTLKLLDGVKVYRPLKINQTEGPGKGLAFSPPRESGYVYKVDADTWTEAQGLMSHSSGNVRVFQWKRVNHDSK